MKTTHIFLLATLTFLLFGCIPSLNPLYTKDDLVTNEHLIGEWCENQSKETWTIEKRDATSYKLIHKQRHEKATFIAHLVKVGVYLFLDLFPEEPDTHDDLYKLHLFPVHTFSKVILNENELTLMMLDSSWLEDGVRNGTIEIAHVISSDHRLLLTASTKELQQFVLKYGNNDKAFMAPFELKKMN
jgi:hypothetical protein